MIYSLTTPLSEGEVRRLRSTDIVYLNGSMFTARDAAHQRILRYFAEGRTLPLNLTGKVLYHCGPLMKKVKDSWQVISAGPTTSMRLESVEAQIIEKLQIRMIIGKGGMGPSTTNAMKKEGGVYCSYPGGAGALASTTITNVSSVQWLDLGMPEAVWELEVENFGPLIVTIDSYGTNHYLEVEKKVKENLAIIHQSLQDSFPE